MSEPIDHGARKRLATLARRLAVGQMTNVQFERVLPVGREAALRDIFLHGLWPLYDDFPEYRLVGPRALTREGRAWVARIVLFLHSGQPYRYRQITGLSQLPVVVTSLATLGWFGRYWRRRQWRDGDESVWPFHSRGEYEEALCHPVFFRGGIGRSGAPVHPRRRE